MNIGQRMSKLQKLFTQLENTPGRIDKENLVNKFCKDNPDLADDLTYCLEVLTGQHKLGYTMPMTVTEEKLSGPEKDLRTFCAPLYKYTKAAVDQCEILHVFKGYTWFLSPLFNCRWRLGINKSLLAKDDKIAPMLAKKFDPNNIPDADWYYLTQKLDGNRCCAYFDREHQKWVFVARSGKLLKVDFDMSSANKMFVFDGEILSREQILNPSQENFNKLSGIVNSINGDKSSLVYMIFDIKEDLDYKSRRQILDCMIIDSENVHILPVLDVCTKEELPEKSSQWLDRITSTGGEGIMINLDNRKYERKRTDALLKYKKVFTMDMEVYDLVMGTGKNDGLVGSLRCRAYDKITGVTYDCCVGTGIEDYLREWWAVHPDDILNRIVEVAYFSTSKAEDRDDRLLSLRFPRFIRVRDDKETTSVD